MTCEVCGEPTSEETSKRPAEGEDEYFTFVSRDQDDPDVGLGITEFEFCSVDHLKVFALSPSDVE